MNDINSHLANFVKGPNPFFNDNPELKNKIIDFLENLNCSEFETNKTRAVEIMQSLLKPNEKESFSFLFKELAKIERGSIPMKLGRDHVVHTVLCFLLGLYINNKCNFEINFFHWKLTSILHDIGYPLSVSMTIGEEYWNKILKAASTLAPSQTNCLSLNLSSFGQLHNHQKSDKAISDRLKAWGVKSTHWQKRKKEGNHGIISALVSLVIIDNLYEVHKGKPNWNPIYFDNDIVSICSAIFVHSLTSIPPIQKERSPLAYLLILSDCLQDWDRPGRGTNENNSNGFGIRCENDGIVFTAPKDSRKNIADELDRKLFGWDKYVRLEPSL